MTAHIKRVKIMLIAKLCKIAKPIEDLLGTHKESIEDLLGSIEDLLGPLRTCWDLLGNQVPLSHFFQNKSYNSQTHK